ncbi:MAG: hypothetical protein LBR11_10805, partial [Deltaproteobacteria bacterium]|nr:hypothetical protein [Deltaproteobacteria bacterium]
MAMRSQSSARVLSLALFLAISWLLALVSGEVLAQDRDLPPESPPLERPSVGIDPEKPAQERSASTISPAIPLQERPRVGIDPEKLAHERRTAAGTENNASPISPERTINDQDHTNKQKNQRPITLNMYKYWQDRTLRLRDEVKDLLNDVNLILNKGELLSEFTRRDRLHNILRQRFPSFRNDPAKQEAFHLAVRGIKERITEKLQPLELLSSELALKQEEVDTLQSELAMANLPPNLPPNLPAPDPRIELEQVQKTLTLIGPEMEVAIARGNTLVTNVEMTINMMEKGLPQAWQSYYLTSLSASGHGLGLQRSYLKALIKWFDSLTSVEGMFFLFPMSSARINDAIFRFLLTMGLTSA